jgi:Allene oxide cyclase
MVPQSLDTVGRPTDEGGCHASQIDRRAGGRDRGGSGTPGGGVGRDSVEAAGDLLTFHNVVFDAADSTPAGHDQGQCIRIAVGSSWECTWTTFLPGGHITVEGPFFDTRNSVLAITGGTGIYRNARGAMVLRSRAGGTKFDFVFRLIA